MANDCRLEVACDAGGVWEPGYCPGQTSIKEDAMNLLSDTQGIASRFSDYIDDLRDVFRCNGVDFGSPENFFAFARTMKKHGGLCRDVARVAKAVTEKETNVSLRTIITIIAVASGGVEIATSDREMSVPIDRVADSLIREGVCSPLHADDPDSLSSNLMVHHPEPIYSRVATGDTGMEFGSVDALTESLTRLELSNLQLKIYLDSIDRQIDRIEPELKIVRSPVSPDDSTDHAGAGFFETVPSETNFRVQNHLFKSNEWYRAATGVWRDFRSYFLRTSFTLPILIGACTLMLAAIFFFWVFGHDTSYAVVRPVDPALEGEGVTAGGSSVAPAVSKPSAILTQGARIGGSASRYSSPYRRADRSTDKSPRSEKKPAQIALKSPSAADDSETAPGMATNTSDVSGGTDRISYLNQPVDVSSGVMAANLVSAPKPSYPALASLTRTHGSVVMRALISRDGSVEHVQVIQGHRLLRGAAKSAVRNWRYRPYKMNGVPVDVATTVSVDFNLHR
jgi:TonB family protein